MSNQTTASSRRWLIWIVTAFIVPIVLAKLALNFDWFNKGATNKGQLIELGQTIQQMGFENEDANHHWLILYPVPDPCDRQCELTLYVINQTYVALGKEVERARPVALSEQPLSDGNKRRLRDNLWVFDKRPAGMDRNLGQIYIVDPMGNFVLTYPLPVSEEAGISLSKSILSDLLKLLKYSKIG